MPQRVWIGIDPGASGGLAVIHEDPVEGVDFRSMFDSLPLVWNWIRHYGANTEMGYRSKAVVELVTGYVGGQGNTGSSQFTFGTNFGAVQMALTAAGIPYDLVHPNVWQKAVGVEPIKGEVYEARKRRLKRRAEELFPQLRVTLRTCDALLLAYHCQSRATNDGRGV